MCITHLRDISCPRVDWLLLPELRFLSPHVSNAYSFKNENSAMLCAIDRTSPSRGLPEAPLCSRLSASRRPTGPPLTSRSPEEPRGPRMVGSAERRVAATLGFDVVGCQRAWVPDQDESRRLDKTGCLGKTD